MAFTQTDLDRIDRAISRGELSVDVDGHRVTYRSMDELIKARNVIDTQVNAASSSSSSTYASFCDD